MDTVTRSTSRVAYCGPFPHVGEVVLPPKPPGAVRLLCQSDTHSSVFPVNVAPEVDVYVHAGDFSRTGTIGEVEQFVRYLAELPYPRKVVIAGNHETTFEEEYYLERGHARFHKGRPQDPYLCKQILLNAKDVTYLQDSGVAIAGLNFYGSPWQPEFMDWAFNLKRGSKEIKDKWAAIPSDTDVLITHGPPKSHGAVSFFNGDVGCEVLLKEVVNRIKPAVHVFG